MGNKSKGAPRFNNRLQKDFDNRLVNLESSSFTGFLRAEALLNLLVDKGIITKEEHNEESYKLFEESQQYYNKGKGVKEPETASAKFEVPTTEDECECNRIETSD